MMNLHEIDQFSKCQRILSGILVMGLSISLVSFGSFGYFFAVLLCLIPMFVRTMHKVTARKQVESIERKQKYLLRKLRQSRMPGYFIGFFKDAFLALVVPVGLFLSSGEELLSLFIITMAALALVSFSRRVCTYRKEYAGVRMEVFSEALIVLFSILLYPLLTFFLQSICGDLLTLGTLADFNEMNCARMVAVYFDAGSRFYSLFSKSGCRWLLWLLLDGGCLLYGSYRFFSAFLLSGEDLSEALNLTNVQSSSPVR